MSNPESTWTPEFSDDRRLIGPLPDMIDLSEFRFRLNYSEEPVMVISDDARVKSITLPCSVVGVNHLVISNLASLEVLNLVGEPGGILESYQWVTISNTPLLRKVFLNGEVRSLSIKLSPSLEYLDVGGCPGIDYVSFLDVPETLKVNVNGCPKLRKIIGINQGLGDDIGLSDQIRNNQRDSLKDGSIYECMTYTDIDVVENIINEGVKALSRRRMLSSDNGSMLGRYDIMAFDPEFKPYSYRILEPLEPVYTGGTGETYPYVFMESSVDADDLEVSLDDGAGNTSPEECLRYMLHWTRMGILNSPHLEDSSDEELLEFLKGAAESNYFEEDQEIKIYLSAHIDSANAQRFLDLSSGLNISLITEEVDDFVYIHSESGVSEDERNIHWSAKVSLPISAAIDQVMRLKEFAKRD